MAIGGVDDNVVVGMITRLRRGDECLIEDITLVGDVGSVAVRLVNCGRVRSCAVIAVRNWSSCLINDIRGNHIVSVYSVGREMRLVVHTGRVFLIHLTQMRRRSLVIHIGDGSLIASSDLTNGIIVVDHIGDVVLLVQHIPFVLDIRFVDDIGMR